MPTAWICFPGAPYTQYAAAQGAKNALIPYGWTLSIPSDDQTPSDSDETPKNMDAYVADYDLLPFETVLENGNQAICSSYVIRKALIRKHYLAQALHTFCVKRNETVSVAPQTWALEIQFADELDELLADDLYDLREALEANVDMPEAEKRWFILKPGMADQANGIRLFNSLEKLVSIFEEFEEESDEDEDTTDLSTLSVYASQLRHFVIQDYISAPLLVRPLGPDSAPRKFHLRAYVTCVGGLQVYLHDDMLALFASMPYTQPNDECDLGGHLSNTCLGERLAGSEKLASVFLWRTLENASMCVPEGLDQVCGTLTRAHLEKVRALATDVIGTAFEAVAREASVHWQLWPNAFEIFGVDLLVGYEKLNNSTIMPDNLRVWLLEINAVCILQENC
ncbi:putative tubulin--tyrosine ligase pby1 [Malassezia vespertilionis]|uniref:Uncharacterized protein n=1 Tax=Malassezia vespertilionis TaxID=2020962 RepID=A0A2N1JGD8_9BASI|nr:putative tubulin--tyrosine ligase pby1 [Malassezia vespertilionis]PKI85621.1 hypothetical protein MVES_000477 [Malassezia vespertilionis]WFD05188.1 putative tubulin--tyrosine ligase pby1 [Malassezia vespertilionis]